MKKLILAVVLLAAGLAVSAGRLEFVMLDEWHTTGSDGACRSAWEHIAEITKTGKVVILTNPGWVPSKTRIIDHQLAEAILASDSVY